MFLLVVANKRLHMYDNHCWVTLTLWLQISDRGKRICQNQQHRGNTVASGITARPTKFSHKIARFTKTRIAIRQFDEIDLRKLNSVIKMSCFLWCSANHEFKAGRLLQLEDIALAKLSGKVVLTAMSVRFGIYVIVMSSRQPKGSIRQMKVGSKYP